MTKWEYYFAHGRANEKITRERINPIGAEGWELVSFETLPYGIQMVFKRPVAEVSPDGWIEWVPSAMIDGPALAPETKVLIKRRDGTKSTFPEPISFWRWSHVGNVGDIVAYRIG